MGLRFLKNGVRDLCLTLFVLGVFISIGTFAPKRTRPTKLSPTNPFPSTGLQCNCLDRRSPVLPLGREFNRGLGPVRIENLVPRFRNQPARYPVGLVRPASPWGIVRTEGKGKI